MRRKKSRSSNIASQKKRGREEKRNLKQKGVRKKGQTFPRTGKGPPNNITEGKKKKKKTTPALAAEWEGGDVPQSVPERPFFHAREKGKKEKSGKLQ